MEDGTPRRSVEPDSVRGLASQLADLRKDLVALGKNASLRNASISGGDGLTVKDSDNNIRLRVSPEDGAIIAYNESGDEVARYGELAHSDPGQFGIEAKDAAGAWIHVGDESVTWGNVAEKPATFPPSGHTHPGGDITSQVGSANTANTAGSATTAGLAGEAEGSQYAWTNNVGGTQWYAVYVGNNGGYKFGRNTSSARYKENIRDFTGDVSDLMALRPVLFDRKPTLDTPPMVDGVRAEGPVNLIPGAKDEYGFIAEEMLEVWPEVVQWFDHGDGLGPQVDGIRYEMIGARLVPILQGLLLMARATKRKVEELGVKTKALEDAAAITQGEVAAQARLIQDLTHRIEAMS